jgi:hypothetical protein
MIFGGVLVAVGMYIWQFVEGKISISILIWVLFFGLPTMVYMLNRGFRIFVFLSNIILYLHVALSRLPVGPGYILFRIHVRGGNAILARDEI